MIDAEQSRDLALTDSSALPEIPEPLSQLLLRDLDDCVRSHGRSPLWPQYTNGFSGAAGHALKIALDRKKYFVRD